MEKYVQLIFIKINLIVNDPQTQNFTLDVTPTIQLWALQNKTTMNLSDQKPAKVLEKLKEEQQLSNIEGKSKERVRRRKKIDR